MNNDNVESLGLDHPKLLSDEEFQVRDFSVEFLNLLDCCLSCPT